MQFYNDTIFHHFGFILNNRTALLEFIFFILKLSIRLVCMFISSTTSWIVESVLTSSGCLHLHLFFKWHQFIHFWMTSWLVKLRTHCICRCSCWIAIHYKVNYIKRSQNPSVIQCGGKPCSSAVHVSPASNYLELDQCGSIWATEAGMSASDESDSVPHHHSVLPVSPL